MSRWLPPLLLILLAVLAGLAATRLEVVHYVAHEPPSMEVQQNPFLAAGRLLSRYGHETRHLPRYQGRHHLPDTDSLMVLQQGSTPLEESRGRELLDWVTDGGWLVLGTRGGEERTTGHRPLLDALGLELAPGEDAPPDPWRERPFADHLISPTELLRRFCASEREELRRQCINVLCGNPGHVPPNTRLERQGTMLQLEPDPRWSFRDKGGETLETEDAAVLSRGGNRHGTQWLEVQVGQGRVMLITDAGIWNNNRLHYLDHARLLETLASERTATRLVSGTAIPLLHVWLWQRAWPLILPLLLLLALWLWRRIPRRGPRLYPLPDNGRDFIAHLRAAGLLLWRRGDTATLLEPLRKEIRATLERQGVAPEQMTRHIALHTQLEPERIEAAMTAVPEEREALVDLVATLQTIRNHYGQYGTTGAGRRHGATAGTSPQ